MTLPPLRCDWCGRMFGNDQIAYDLHRSRAPVWCLPIGWMEPLDGWYPSRARVTRVPVRAKLGRVGGIRSEGK